MSVLKPLVAICVLYENLCGELRVLSFVNTAMVVHLDLLRYGGDRV